MFGLPVINVGDRQKGRERGANVVQVPNVAEAVIAALDELGPTPQRHPPNTSYGDGRAGPRVAAVLVDALQIDHLRRKMPPLAGEMGE